MSKVTDEIVENYKKLGIVCYLLRVSMREKDDTLDEESNDEIQKIEHSEDVFYAVLKKPGRREVGLAMTAGKDPIAMGESIIKNCWLDGDEEIRDLNNQDTIGLSAAIQAMKLMETGQGSLKKL